MPSLGPPGMRRPERAFFRWARLQKAKLTPPSASCCKASAKRGAKITPAQTTDASDLRPPLRSLCRVVRFCPSANERFIRRMPL